MSLRRNARGQLVLDAGPSLDITLEGQVSVSPSVDTDVLSKVSADDPAAGYLEDKIVPGDNVSIVKSTDEGGNEILTVNCTLVDTDTDLLVKTSEDDVAGGFLEDKIVQGTNITIVKSADIDGNEILTINGTVNDTDVLSKVSAADDGAGYLEDKIVQGTNISIVKSADIDGNEILTINGTVNDTDQLTKISLADTVAGYLESKLLQGTNITIVKGNTGANETLTINCALPTPADELVKVSSGDTTAGNLETKIIAGTNVTVTKGNALGNETFTIAAPGATTATLDLYVNAATGNDTTGDGTLALPYATVTKALTKVPLIIKHAVIVHVYAGTYAETIVDGRSYANSVASLTIQGEDFTTPTLGSGSITSGTLGTLSGTSRTVAGAAWTTNELRGMLIKITSGSFNGRYYPIVGNTATAIEIGHMSTTPNGATFSIVQPAAIITKGSGLNYSAFITNNGNLGNCLVIKRCALQSTSTGMYVQAGAGGLSECVVSGGSKGVVMGGPSTVLEVWASYVTGSGSAAEINQGGAFYTPASCFHGGTVTVLIGTLGAWWLSGSAISAALWVQGGSTGISVTGFCNFRWDGAATRSAIRNHSSTGIAIGGQARGSVSTVDITFCTNQCISFDVSATGSGHSSLQLSSTKLQNSFRGIKFSSTHNHVQLTASSDISACTTAGVQFSANSSTVVPAFNSIHFATTTTTSGNTAGDITMDGSSFDSLANLRLDADKTFVDTVRFNRALAD